MATRPSTYPTTVGKVTMNQTPKAARAITTASINDEIRVISVLARLTPGRSTGRPASTANWRAFRSNAVEKLNLSSHCQRISRARRSGS